MENDMFQSIPNDSLPGELEVGENCTKQSQGLQCDAKADPRIPITDDTKGSYRCVSYRCRRG